MITNDIIFFQDFMFGVRAAMKGNSARFYTNIFYTSIYYSVRSEITFF